MLVFIEQPLATLGLLINNDGGYRAVPGFTRFANKGIITELETSSMHGFYTRRQNNLECFWVEK